MNITNHARYMSNDSRDIVTISKMKKLLLDISTKNEDLNKDNEDMNKKILSLVRLLKAKDEQLIIVNNQLKFLSLMMIFKTQTNKIQKKIQKCFNCLRYKQEQKRRKLKNKAENIYDFSILPMKIIKKEIGVGIDSINPKFYIRKELGVAILAKRKQKIEEVKKEEKIIEIRQRIFTDLIISENDKIIIQGIQKTKPKIIFRKDKVFFSFVHEKPKEQKKEEEYLINQISYQINKVDNQSDYESIPEKEFTDLSITNELTMQFPKIKKKSEPLQISVIYSKTLSYHKKEEKPLIIEKKIEENNNIFYEEKSENFSIFQKNTSLQQYLPFYKALYLYEKLNYISSLKPKISFLNNLFRKTTKLQMIQSFAMCKKLLITTKLEIFFKNQKKKEIFKNFNFLQRQLLREEIKNCIAENEELSQSNQILQSKIEQFQNSFTEYEKSKNYQNEQNEKKLNSKIEKLTNELKDKVSQYEKLKQLSNESTMELINTSNQCTQQKLELKQLAQDISELNKNNELLAQEISNKNDIISKLKSQIKEHSNEYEEENKKKSVEVSQHKKQISNLENQIESLNIQIVKVNREMQKIKAANEDLLKCNEQLSNLVRNSKNYEIENATLKSENEQFKEECEEINKKYFSLKKEYDDLKELSEESKSDLLKALGEMEAYSNLLQNLELRIKEAQEAKEKAENERDNAINDVKTIRQRYINILGETKK